MATLTLSQISKSFGPTKVLSDLSLTIEDGEFFFLLGPSGCGKSTLLRILAGLETADSGAVFYDGKDITHVPTHKRGIGMVFQQYALWPHMTVFQNVAFGLSVQGVRGNATTERVEETLERVGMHGYSRRFPHELSGGQQQRVALARALATRPRVVLLDEPLSNLDTQLRESIRRELSSLHKQLGITMVCVTHDHEDALSHADRMAILARGELMQIGTPKELYKHPYSSFVAGFLGDINALPCTRTEAQPDRLCICGQELLVSETHISPRLSPSSQEALALIRPEQITLSVESPTANSLCGTVVSSTFKGSWNEVEVALDPVAPRVGASVSASYAGGTLLARIPNTAGTPIFTAKMRVVCSLPEHSIALVPSK